MRNRPTTRHVSKLIGIFSAVMLLLCGAPHSAQQSSAFSYQGQLRDGGTNANGTYGMAFKLFDAAGAGNQIGNGLSNNLALVNGLFTANLDFGPGAFNGAGRWLEVTVAGETLSPRLRVLPAPYALFSASAATVPDAAISDAKIVSISGSKVSGVVPAASFITNGTWMISIVPHGDSSRVEFIRDGITRMTVGDRIFMEVPSLEIAGDLHVEGNLTASNFNATASPAMGGVPQMQVFYANGNFTVPTNVSRVMVEMWGGGGGGGMGSGFHDNQGVLQTGGGGGGGEYVKATFSVTPGSSHAVTVGQGGTGAVTGNGGSGGVSRFGNFTGAGGGSGGTGAPDFRGGFGGNNNSQDPQVHRVAGSNGQTYYDGKSGGAAGGGGGFPTGGNSGGTNGFEPGGGGNGDGGRGANGRIIVYY